MKISGRNFSELLKEAREIKGLTQEQFADNAGKKRSYISRVETGYGNKIKLHTLFELVEKGLNGKVVIELNFEANDE